MTRSLGIACALLLTPVVARAEVPARAPEALLAADSLVYLRFDGIDPHRQAFERSALAEVLQGDLHSLLDYVTKLVRNALGEDIIKDRLLKGVTPDQLLQHQAATDQLPQMFELLRRHGFVLGVELIGVLPPRAQLTLVLPQAGREAKDRDAVFAALRLLALVSQKTLKETKQGGRTILELPGTDPVRLACWREQDDVVLTIGTEMPEHTFRRAENKKSKRPNLAADKRFQAVAAFKQYETFARGYVDCARLLELARATGPGVNRVSDALGLGSLRELTLHLGFEDRVQRSTFTLHLAGERKGLFQLSKASQNGEPKPLPPLPPDASSVVTLQLAPTSLYECIVQAVGAGAETNPSKFDQLLGIDLRRDILAALGPTVVLYNSPGEGPFILGRSLAVEVKDSARLDKALAAVAQALPAALGSNVSVRKQTYRGAALYLLDFARQIPFPPLRPAFTCHQGWLVLSLFPQPVQGFVLRSTGKYAVWKPGPLNERLCARMAQNPHARLLGWSETDPRPNLKQLCQLGTFIGGIANAAQGNSFDVALVPNFQAITEPLFPDVTLLVAEGDTVRLESHASINVLTELAGLDSFLLVTVLGNF
jgi:hypothetical protein